MALRQGHRLIRAHALEKHGHGQRSGLALAPRLVHQTAHKMVDVCGYQGAAVTFDADDFLCQHDSTSVGASRRGDGRHATQNSLNVAQQAAGTNAKAPWIQGSITQDVGRQRFVEDRVLHRPDAAGRLESG
jgi:hypothetical protein